MNYLTDEFSLSTMTHSDTAVQLGIENVPNYDQATNLRSLYDNVLQRLVRALPGKINVTVAFRNRELNDKVGGKPNSQHLSGMAADIEYYDPEGKEDNMAIVKAVKNLAINYDQMILEKMKDGKPSWIHISYNHGKNRKQYLTL